MMLLCFQSNLYFALTLRARTVFRIFGKTKAISVYWLAVQQQTSTSRQHTFYLFYPKFSEEFNEPSLKLRKQQERPKLAKTKIVTKTICMWHLRPKG